MVHTASNMHDTMGWGNYAIPFILQMCHWRGKNCNIRYTSISKLGIPPRLIFLSYSFHSWYKGYGEITQARHNYPQSTVHTASNLLVWKTVKLLNSLSNVNTFSQTPHLKAVRSFFANCGVYMSWKLRPPSLSFSAWPPKRVQVSRNQYCSCSTGWKI